MSSDNDDNDDNNDTNLKKCLKKAYNTAGGKAF